MSFILCRPSVSLVYRHSRILGYLNSQCRKKSTELINEEDDIWKPVKFSTSDAGWKFQLPKLDSSENPPAYKPIILFSTLMFCVVYLMFFRPANDIDEELEMPLGKRLLLIKESQILDEKKKLMAAGYDGASCDEELRKIHELRVKYKYI